MLHRLPSAIPLLLVLAAPRAQDDLPSPQDLARQAQGLAQQLQLLRDADAPAKASLDHAQQAIDEFAAAISQQANLTLDHYVQASSPFLQIAPKAGLQIAEAGIARFADARFLWDHVGFARLQLAVEQTPSAGQTAELVRAEQAFRKALSQTPDTFHAHLGIAQTLSQLDRPEEALAEFALVLQDEQGKQAMPDAWLLRAGLLMRLGRTKEAVPLLKGAGVPDEMQGAARALLLRAHALGNDGAAAAALIATMQKDAPGLRTLVAAADALAYLGKKAEALQLLAQRPADGTDGEETSDQLLAQSAAAMEAFWKAADATPKGPLRGALTKALGHHFLVMDATAKPQPKNTEVGSSPLLMSRLLAMAPSSAEKDWGNRVLQVLCIRAVRDHKATPFEAQVASMTKDMRTPGEADVPAIVMAMRWDVGNPAACGVLTGLRALEKLQPKAPAKK